MGREESSVCPVVTEKKIKFQDENIKQDQTLNLNEEKNGRFSGLLLCVAPADVSGQAKVRHYGKALKTCEICEGG